MTNDVVRPATPDDRIAFLQLAALYLREMEDAGTEVLATRKSLAFYGALFASYVEHGNGIVLLVGDYAFSIAGGVEVDLANAQWPITLDTKFGKTAYGWGTYVRPQHRRSGVASRLRTELKLALRSLGFETLIGGVHVNNEQGMLSLMKSNFDVYQVVGYERLTEA
jgi:GNAT superfamily N-acetyltransferase